MAGIVIVRLFGSELFVGGYIISPYLPFATLFLMPALLTVPAIFNVSIDVFNSLNFISTKPNIIS